jgi:glutathione synthase/RimK-type ligase-like ATP-grasp enzyme
MLIAIHSDKCSDDGRVHEWSKILSARKIDSFFVDILDPGALDDVRHCDGLMWHWGEAVRDRRLIHALRVIEFHLKKAVFPNHATYWPCRNKLSQLFLMRAFNIPMPETWIFWDRREALDWVESTTYPKVFKLAIGGGAKNVALVASSSEAKRLVSAMFEPGIVPGQVESFVGKKNGSAGTRLRLFSSRCRRAVNYVLYSRSPNLAQPEKGYVYFQEYIPNNQFTNSISIVGNRAFSSCSFNRSNDFRAFGDIVHTDHSAVSRDCIRLAFEISSKANLLMMSYDMLLRDNSPVVLEMKLKNIGGKECWRYPMQQGPMPGSAKEAEVDVFLQSIKKS